MTPVILRGSRSAPDHGHAWLANVVSVGTRCRVWRNDDSFVKVRHFLDLRVPSKVMAQAVSRRGPVTGTATAGKKRRKPFLLDLYGTAVGKKYVMAITEIVLWAMSWRT